MAPDASTSLRNEKCTFNSPCTLRRSAGSATIAPGAGRGHASLAAICARNERGASPATAIVRSANFKQRIGSAASAECAVLRRQRTQLYGVISKRTLLRFDDWTVNSYLARSIFYFN